MCNKRQNRDRGAVLVEAALVIPLLILLALGAMDTGIAWSVKSSITSGVRTAALTVAESATQEASDLEMLEAFGGELGSSRLDRVNYLGVFRIPDGQTARQAWDACQVYAPPATWAGGPGCVFYNPAVLQGAHGGSAGTRNWMVANRFDDNNGHVLGADGSLTSYNCKPGTYDTHWCPAERLVGGDNNFGIGVSYQHEWTTGILPFDAPEFVEIVASSTLEEDGAAGIEGGTSATNILGVFDGSFSLQGHRAADVSFTGTWPHTASQNHPNTQNLTNHHFGLFGQKSTRTWISSRTIGQTLCAEFDLYIIGGWDGSGPDGPDTVTVTLGNTVVVGTYDQNVPGAADGSHLGYAQPVQIVHQKVCTQVATSSVLLTVDGELWENGVITSNFADESWGYDNLKIYTE